MHSVSRAAGTATAPVIRTPDQRLRVFVSSTLAELADERRAARAAIESLHLTPVMFELGARAHPPRVLYRAYLEQSQVFLAIYGERYGWVAPGEPVSGIEDEYNLSGDRPKLIYVRNADTQRDPALEALLDRIRQDDRVSYRMFSTPSELQTLVAEDLAILVSERFTASLEPASPWAAPTRAQLPAPITSFVGRQAELLRLTELLSSGENRLVTVTGLGGIGKSRLAIEAARSIRGEFADGVVPVWLAPVAGPEGVVPAISAALGLTEVPGMTPLEVLTEYLSDRSLLLMLDNFEHVMDAVPVVATILANCPEIRILVTSREILRLSGEKTLEVGPLLLPSAEDSAGAQDLLESEAVRLFADRASSVSPGFALNEETAPLIAEICRRVDGVPLAIELAAARVRLFPLKELSGRLEDRLGFLVHGSRDLPERQRTLRATLEWSYALLDRKEAALFAHLSVFLGGWTLEAAETVCGEDDEFLEKFASLLDKSLIRVQASRAGKPRFSMLETVRQYGVERLREEGEEDNLLQRHSEYFLAWAQSLHAVYRRELSRQAEWTADLNDDLENLRAAMRRQSDQGHPEYVVRLGEALWDFWWIRSHHKEAIAWMEEVLRTGALSKQDEAMANFIVGVSAIGLSDYPMAFPALSAAYESFASMDDRHGMAMTAVPLGVALTLGQGPGTGEKLVRDAMDYFRQAGDAWGVFLAYFGLGRLLAMEQRLPEAIAVNSEGVREMRATGELMLRSLTLLMLGWTLVLTKAFEQAQSVFDEALDVLARLQNLEGTARALEGVAAMALERAQPERAATLLGAAEGTRRAVGARVWALDRPYHERLETATRGALGSAEFDARFAEGLNMPSAQAIALARS